MNTTLMDTAETQAVTESGHHRYRVDPMSKEFTHVLMKCFNEARQVAIKEFHETQARGVSEKLDAGHEHA
jgi:hypothetical protein